VQRAPAAAGALPPVGAVATRGLLVDDAAQAGAGQMRRGDFLAELRTAVCAVAEDALRGSAWSVAGCPFIDRWFAYYEGRGTAQVERAVHRYVPESIDAPSARDYIALVTARLGPAVRRWRETGEVTGLPEGVRAELPPPDDGAADTGSAIARMPLSDGAPAVPPHDPGRVLARLGPGAQLDVAVQGRMESAFGTTFSGVRVHTGAPAESVARELHARALTVGTHVAFGAGEYHPGVPGGDLLIAHELAHVVQQSGAAGRAGDEAALERAASYQGIRAMMGERAAGAWASATRGDAQAYSGAIGRGGLRLQRCMMPSTAPRDERTIEQVRADLERSGELGPRVSPRPLPANADAGELPASTPLSPRDQQALSAAPPALTPAEMALDLGTITAELERLEPLLRGRTGGPEAIAAARARVATVRGTIGTGDPAVLSRRIQRTRVLLEQTIRALENLAAVEQQLTQPGVPHATRYAHEFGGVGDLFGAAVGRALEDDVLERFQAADRAAARLPWALLGADLDAFGSLSAGAEMLQPSMREIHAWAARLRPRLSTLETRAGELARARARHAPNLPTLEAEFRDLKDGVTLSIEALSYWEQLARGYAYMAGSPPYDIRAFDAIARLMVRVRHMRDADERGDVALLEVLVRQYRDDEDVQNFLNNIGVFVAFSRVAVSLGIMMVAALASAGVGAGATAVIGTTTTTTGAITAFVGVNALEALTFTAVSRGLQSVIPGQQTQGSFWSDLAWNFGLFSVMKAVNLGVLRVTRPLAVPGLTRVVQHAVTYPLLVGYGAIRYHVENGEWPSREQLARMEAETLFLMAAFAVVNAPARTGETAPPRELALFRQRYGLEFGTLDAGRRSLADQVLRAARDPATPDSTRADVARRAELLEGHLRALLERIRADSDIRLPELRDELAGFGSRTEALRLRVRLMRAGLAETSIAAIETRVEALPELRRDPVRVHLADAAEYAFQVLMDAPARQAALETIARAATNPRITGFEGWVRFSTAQSAGTSPAEQARNFLDDVGELSVAEGMSRTLRPRERVEVGGDARQRTRPGTSEFLPSFDIAVTGGSTPRNVEVYTPNTARPTVGDLGTAINHAADKIIVDPALPADYQTGGHAEAAVRISWPPASSTTGAGTIESAPNGDIVLVTGDGRRIPRGNFFADYVANLNHPTRAPAGARRVDALTVYDLAGNVIYRYTRNPTTSTWSGAAP
jgi:hypothetical protein